MAKNKWYVQKREDGKWEVLKEGSERASAVGSTQAEMISRAREIAGNAGGGEVRIKRPDGRIRDSDTVPEAPDPFPPRDEN